MTGITPDGIEIHRDFGAPPADVFDAWTSASHFSRWFGGEHVDVPASGLDYQPIEGRAWTATMVLPDGNTIRWTGEFVEIVPEERFVFTITDTPEAPERATITVELAPGGGGTRMRFAQQAPAFSREQREALIGGWQSFFDELDAGLPHGG